MLYTHPCYVYCFHRHNCPTGPLPYRRSAVSGLPSLLNSPQIQHLLKKRLRWFIFNIVEQLLQCAASATDEEEVNILRPVCSMTWRQENSSAFSATKMFWYENWPYVCTMFCCCWSSIMFIVWWHHPPTWTSTSAITSRPKVQHLQLLHTCMIYAWIQAYVYYVHSSYHPQHCMTFFPADHGPLFLHSCGKQVDHARWRHFKTVCTSHVLHFNRSIVSYSQLWIRQPPAEFSLIKKL